MTAILATLPFVATLWLLVVLGARVLEESGAKIAAALKGQPAPLPPVTIRPARARRAAQGHPVSYAPAGFRAAA